MLLGSSFKKNILANFVGKSWSLFSVFIFVPIYINILGIEQYGLISFFATMQSVLFLLEAGLSATLRRELSTADTSVESRAAKFKLFRSSEMLFAFIALTIVGGVVLLSNFIANSWLQVQSVDIQVAETAIQLMGVSIAAQLLSSLYFGGLLGLDKHQEANYYQIFWSIFKNGLVIFIFYFVEPDIRYFFAWFIVSDILYLLLLRRSLVKGLVDGIKWTFGDFKILKASWKYTSGIMLVSIISVFNLQLDKLLVSKRFALSDLGVYNLSFSLSQVPVIIINAFCIAIFSRFVYFYTKNEMVRLNALFVLSYKVLLIVAAALSFTMALFSKDLLLVWTGNELISDQATNLVMIMIMGSMFYTLQFIPFNFVLSRGVTKINVVFGVANLVVMPLSLVLLTNYYGLEGAAFNWLLLSSLFTPIYISYIYKRYIAANWLKWLFRDTVLPVLFTGGMVMLLYAIIKFGAFSPLVNIVLAAFSGAGIIALAVYLFIKDIAGSFRIIDTKSD